MKRIRIYVLVAALAAVAALQACKTKQYMTGYFEYGEFCKKANWKTFYDEKYKPKERWMDSIAGLGITDSIRVRLYLGTYCGDSKRWVPRFFALKDRLPLGPVEVVSVDTTKKDEKGLAEADRIWKIPTFLFFYGDRELGRITEKPYGRLEENIYNILKSR